MGPCFEAMTNKASQPRPQCGLPQEIDPVRCHGTPKTKSQGDLQDNDANGHQMGKQLPGGVSPMASPYKELRDNSMERKTPEFLKIHKIHCS